MYTFFVVSRAGGTKFMTENIAYHPPYLHSTKWTAPFERRYTVVCRHVKVTIIFIRKLSWNLLRAPVAAGTFIIQRMPTETTRTQYYKHAHDVGLTYKEADSAWVGDTLNYEYRAKSDQSTVLFMDQKSETHDSINIIQLRLLPCCLIMGSILNVKHPSVSPHNNIRGFRHRLILFLFFFTC